VNAAPRVLVTGANGQVGHELLRALAGKPSPSVPLPLDGGRQVGSDAERGVFARALNDRPLPQEGGRAAGAGGWALLNGKVIPATRDGLLENGSVCERIDLADPGDLTAARDRIAPDVIINAAAYTAVDRAEDESDLAQRVNGDALGVMGAWAARHGARVVHYSTDYVFDGRAGRAYREGDAPRPVSAYGRSKLAGEMALRQSGARHLIFRTAWVYAARGKNFLRTMLRLGAERDELRVVDDQIGAPTPARLIAETTARVLAQWLDDAVPARDGVYHLVAGGQTSWCGFARAIFDKAIPLNPPSLAKGEAGAATPGARGEDDYPLPREGGRAQRGGMPSHAPRIVAIRTADYPTKAARPAWSVLDTGKLRTTFGVALPDWQAALDGVVDELAACDF
jgi:dTDP-4-dehydrorhamnose reductase